MEESFKIWETNRHLYLKLINNYSLEQLNKIPDGFSNNLIWNLGHIIVAQQGLVYRLSGLPVNVSEEMTNTYKNGSKPTGQTTQGEFQRFSHPAVDIWQGDYFDLKPEQLGDI